jgi:hypothetical protein
MTYLPAQRDADGEVTLADENGFVTLVADTYFFAESIRGSDVVGVQIETDDELEAVFTIEDTNITESKVTDWDASSPAWVPENPDSSYVATTESSGWTVDALELTKTDDAAGSAIVHIGNIGSRRLRVRAVVSTGGLARVSFHGKG